MASGCRLARVYRLNFGRLKKRYLCVCQSIAAESKKNTSPYTIRTNHQRISHKTVFHVPTLPATDSLENPLSRRGLGNVQFSRHYSTDQGLPEYTKQDPFKVIEGDLSTLCDDIKSALSTSQEELQNISQYHFDGQGKAFRPMVVMLTAKACNIHNGQINGELFLAQRKIAMIAEMIHTASLVHDDVIDAAETRRGKLSVQQAWGQRKAIVGGDFILSVSSIILARIRNEEVIKVLSQVLEDLVKGEFMQLGSKEDETERFNHYLRKTFKKTASLVAKSCKSVAILGNSSPDIVEAAYQYGRNIGIAFQLVDDLLDFTSSDIVMGKPTAADLKLGLATAPVLFAAHQYPELNAMIMRRFTEDGDVERAREFVAKSEGVQHTRYLAEHHSKEAISQISLLKPSMERDALISVTNKVLNRMK